MRKYVSIKGPIEDNTGLDSFTIGERVQLHPGTDAWMMGDRYGTVVHIGRTLLNVKMDRSNKTRRFRPDNVMHLD